MSGTYDCNCFKCKKTYRSADAFDKDGQGFCKECNEEKMKIARAVDAKLAKQRLLDPTPMIQNQNAMVRKSVFAGKNGEAIWLDKNGNRL